MTESRSLLWGIPLLLLTSTAVTALALRATLLGHLRGLARPATEFAADEFRAMLLWGGSFVAFIVVAVWAAIVSWEIIDFNAVEANVSRRTIGWAVLLLAFCVALRRPLAILFDLPETSRLDSLKNRFPVFVITSVGNTVGTLSVALIVAAVVVLLRTQSSDSAILRDNLSRARLLLYSAAAVLVVGVAEIYLLFDLPAHIQHGKEFVEENAAIHVVAQSTVVVCGVIYSLFLLCIFVPLGVVQERDVRGYVATHGASDASAKGTQFDRSALGTLGEVVALLAPVLTALGILK